MLRERAGARELTLELPDGARVRDALESLGDLAAGLPLVMAVNREYAEEDQVLDPGDELALIPPVSGGSSAAVVHARVTAEPLKGSRAGLVADVLHHARPYSDRAARCRERSRNAATDAWCASVV